MLLLVKNGLNNKRSTVLSWFVIGNLRFEWCIAPRAELGSRFFQWFLSNEPEKMGLRDWVFMS